MSKIKNELEKLGKIKKGIREKKLDSRNLIKGKNCPKNDICTTTRKKSYFIGQTDKREEIRI